MNPVVYYLVGGAGFFVGVLLTAAGLLAAEFGRAVWLRRVARVVVLVGALLVAVSATPLPIATVAALAVTILVAFVSVSWRKQGGTAESKGPSLRRTIVWVTVAVWLVAAVWELRWQIPPRLPSAAVSRLHVIGDSVSAGTGETPWPERLGERFDVDVRNLSHVGATAASVLERAELIEGDGVIVIEIGGNDVLGSTSCEQFRRDLDALLAAVVAPDRVVLMFELPVPPTYECFARAQRSLANRYSVHLVPRRVLLGVFTAESSTLDSIHLSEAGHDRMAEVVWGIVSPAMQRAGK